MYAPSHVVSHLCSSGQATDWRPHVALVFQPGVLSGHVGPRTSLASLREVRTDASEHRCGGILFSR